MAVNEPIPRERFVYTGSIKFLLKYKHTADVLKPLWPEPYAVLMFTLQPRSDMKPRLKPQCHNCDITRSIRGGGMIQRLGLRDSPAPDQTRI